VAMPTAIGVKGIMPPLDGQLALGGILGNFERVR